MHVINAMFGRKMGGIEQAFVDYCQAIKAQGNKVTALVFPGAPIIDHLLPLGINIVAVKNVGAWDIFAKSYIRKILGQTSPKIVIAHGNRAVSLLKSPCRKKKIPLVGVTHNYSIKHLIGLDAVFGITEDLRKTVIAAGQPAEKVFAIPNMIRMPEKLPKVRTARHKPPVIGAMGRFVKKKGFDVYLHALAELKKKKIPFSAVLGGKGDEEARLKELVEQLDLSKHIEFTGWVEDKAAFFKSVDIFCLPSIHEPFGIVLLEAFLHGVPVITSDAEGPAEIAHHEKDALITAKRDAKALAKAMIVLLEDSKAAAKLARAGQKHAGDYAMESVGKRIVEVLHTIVTSRKKV